MKLTFIHRKIILVCLLLTGAALNARAQLNPVQSSYFQNRYLYNPAMAGIEQGLNLNMGYKKQWSNFPGAPRTTAFTGDLQLNKVGMGLNIADDKEGLIRSTRIMGTYAYHLPLTDNNQKLSFGLSLGVNNSRIDYDAVNGDIADMEIARYNQLKPYADGDLGMAYTSNSLYVGAALPNLKSVFFKASDERFDADRLLFMASASYRFSISNDDGGLMLEPLAAYRIVKGYKDILDGGFNFTMNNYGFYVQGIYHSSRSLGLGLGLDQREYNINFSYNLETGILSNYTTGAFELGLKLKLFGKK